MKSGVIGVLATMLGVVVALCAWLFPFHPIRPSPFDKATNVPALPPVERSKDQAQNLTVEPNRLLGSEVPKQSRPKAEAPRRYESQAVINDPDGYTNVRLGPGVQYEIVARILEGEVFYVIYQQGSWWQVRTKEGKYGYMHRSRIRMV